MPLIESDQCFTPPAFFQTLRLKFDLDVASPQGGVPWIPARKFFTESDNGLAQSWQGRIWMNPPYSNPRPWVEKFLEHGNGVALIPISKSLWFKTLWDSSCSLVFPEPHIKFVKNGKPHSIFMPCCLIALKADCVRAISRFGVVR